MKRGRRSLSDQATGKLSTNGNGNQKLVKSTYMLDSIMKEHLAFVAWAKQTDQSDIVREALTRHLQSIGCDLTKPPQRPQFRE